MGEIFAEQSVLRRTGDGWRGTQLPLWIGMNGEYECRLNLQHFFFSLAASSQGIVIQLLRLKSKLGMLHVIRHIVGNGTSLARTSGVGGSLQLSPTPPKLFSAVPEIRQFHHLRFARSLLAQDIRHGLS
jgi:hypothetical protein